MTKLANFVIRHSVILHIVHPIAEATDGLDTVGGFAKFFAKAADVSIHSASVDGALVAPYIVEENVPALHTPTPLDQCSEELELGGGKLDFLAAQSDLMADAIHGDVAELQRVCGLNGSIRAAQNALDAERKFTRRKGLGHIVVGAQFKAEDAVHFVGFRGEHDDGDVLRGGVGFESLTDLKPAHAGEHQIEHDERG